MNYDKEPRQGTEGSTSKAGSMQTRGNNTQSSSTGQNQQGPTNSKQAKTTRDGALKRNYPDGDTDIGDPVETDPTIEVADNLMKWLKFYQGIGIKPEGFGERVGQIIWLAEKLDVLLDSVTDMPEEGDDGDPIEPSNQSDDDTDGLELIE